MSFLGGLIHGVASVVSHVVPGPIGMLAGVVSNATASHPAAASLGIVSNLLPVSPSFGVQGTGPVIRGPSFNVGPGGASFTGPSFTGPTVGVQLGGPGTGMQQYRGYHPNKTLVKAQVMQQNRGGLTPGMQRRVSQVVNSVVRNRHMNVMNPRAAHRAIHRLKGVHKTLKRIESAMPKRPCKCSSRRKH